MKVAYRFPNPLFIIWLVICGFFIAFFYDCGNALKPFQPYIMAYICYANMCGFILLAILPYLLGLTITFEKHQPEKEEIPVQEESQIPVGNDYFIPLWGYLRYQVPNLVKRKRWLILIENTLVYFLLGLFNGIINYPFTVVYGIVLAAAVVFEYFIYYKNWMPFMSLPKTSSAINRGLAYLFVQEHAFSFMALGWIIGLFIH